MSCKWLYKKGSNTATTYLALRPHSGTSVHPTVVADHTATNSGTVELFGNNLGVFLSPHVYNDTPGLEASFCYWKFLRPLVLRALRFTAF